jgi:hypothetical protein
MKVESVKTIISEEKGFFNFNEAQLNIKETGEWLNLMELKIIKSIWCESESKIRNN